MPNAMPHASPQQLPLRDIHLPTAEVSWWPPAIGWWLLPLVIMLCGAVIWWMLRLRRRGRWRQEALAELAAIEALYCSNNDHTQLLRDLSTLLRRVAISRFPRRDCAALTGDAWLQFLNDSTPLSGFSDGPGRVLRDGPYQRSHDNDHDATALITLCRDWLAALPRKVAS